MYPYVNRMILVALAFFFTFCEIQEYVEPILPTPYVGTLGTDSPAPPTLVYETSFEEVEKKNRQQLTWEFPHWFEFAAMHQEDGGIGSGNTGARMWVDTTLAHSGAKSIGLELYNIERSRRAEFIIYPKDYLGKEYYISYWLYLPSDWGLFEPNIDWDWYEIGNPYSSVGVPYSAIHISNPDANQQYFTVSLELRNEAGIKSSAGEKQLLLPKGRWFEVYYYVKRDQENGAIKLWLDGALIAEKTGFPTMHSSSNNFSISIAKIYYERGDKTPHELWIDDLKLYNITNAD